MKLIKPLLIYVTWIAFVWLCVGLFAGDYTRLDDGSDSMFLFVVFLYSAITPGIILITKEDETNNP